MTGDAPTSDNGVFVLATFNRTVALPLLIALIGSILLVVLAAIFEIVRNSMTGSYNFLLPIIALTSAIILPYLIRNLLNCWLRKPLLYVKNGKLIDFDPKFFSQDVNKVLSLSSIAAPSGVKIVSASGSKKIRLALAMQGGNEVARRWNCYLSS